MLHAELSRLTLSVIDAFLAGGEVARGERRAGIDRRVADVSSAVRFALALDACAFVAEVFAVDVAAIIIDDARRAAAGITEGRRCISTIACFETAHAFV